LGKEHAPQSCIPPQPSPIIPQYCDVPALHLVGVHMADTQRPEELHTWPASQAPQFMARPQPSPMLPQYRAAPT
jgi:hypothetical protein